ncbi:hypothetical protein D3C85_1457200 [compost metagenome]
MEMVRRQYHREHRHFGFQLDLHQAADHRLGDEFMAIDTAIDHQARGDDTRVAAALGQ